MCIAILDLNGVSEENLYNSFQNNPDGVEFLYNRNGVLRATKLFGAKFEAVMQNYERIKKEAKDSPVAIHFRIATHGTVDKSNCHPFFVQPQKIGLVHNGILPLRDPKNKKSDTALFAEYLRKFPDPFQDAFMIEMLESYCHGSKVIFLNNRDEYLIINENLGHWDTDGNWYSNYTYNYCNYYDFGGTRAYKGGTTTESSGFKTNYKDDEDWYPERSKASYGYQLDDEGIFDDTGEWFYTSADGWQRTADLKKDNPDWSGYIYKQGEGWVKGDAAMGYCDLCGKSAHTKYDKLAGGDLCEDCTIDWNRDPVGTIVKTHIGSDEQGWEG